MSEKVYTVAVFDHPESRVKHAAYLRDYSPSWPGCCLHRVRAATGEAAKREAIGFHKLKVGCSTDPVSQEAMRP